MKVINDPIYGLIVIPSELIFRIIEHPYFQRLRRIKQLSMSSMVYPGALHTRFNHAIGCMYLMNTAINTLKIKNVNISDNEKEAVMIAILLHDIGHGPFSHSLENYILNISHENISVILMKKLNEEFEGKLDLAIKIFENKYHRKFLYQLISSQLDIDRIDYLKRDSYFTGVSEGVINSDRLITMLNVHNDELVIEQKAIYSVEKFLIARKIMYWQVYYHKTVLATESMISNIFKRAKYLSKNKKNISISENLNYFLENNINENNFGLKEWEYFTKLDDFDLDFSIKKWQNNEDKILSELCENLINRELFKVEISNKPFSNDYTNNIKKIIKENKNEEYISYFFGKEEIKNTFYNDKEDPIKFINSKNELRNFLEISNETSIPKFNYEIEIKNYIYYPKKI